MVFATLGFYITTWFSKPAHRKAVSRNLQRHRKFGVKINGSEKLTNLNLKRN